MTSSDDPTQVRHMCLTRAQIDFQHKLNDVKMATSLGQSVVKTTNSNSDTNSSIFLFSGPHLHPLTPVFYQKFVTISILSD